MKVLVRLLCLRRSTLSLCNDFADDVATSTSISCLISVDCVARAHLELLRKVQMRAGEQLYPALIRYGPSQNRW